MPNIFTVDSGDATAIQQHYEQVIEILLRAILDTNEGSNEPEGLKIFDRDKLVYGHERNHFRDEVSGFSGELLNPQLINQLQQLRFTPVGVVIEGAINKRVELNGQVVLQSDKEGRVIINSLLQSEVIQEKSNQILPNEDILLEKDDITPIDSTDNSVKNISNINFERGTNLEISGSKRVIQSLESLEDSPLRNLLSAEISQLRTEVIALQQERNLYQELIQQRLQQPQNTSWWQQTINHTSVVLNSITSAVKVGIREFQENSTQNRIAASFRTLFHLQTQPGENKYQAGDYQISRDGSLYEVKESATGKEIMQFRSTPLGVKVEKVNLETPHLQDINALHRSLQHNEPIPTSFDRVGKQEAEYFTRVERVTNALVQYAVAQQREVEIDGVFSYKWQANPDGKIRIDAKDGRGTLLEKFGGKLNSNMSQRDLNYFEQIIPKLQPNRQQKDVTISQSQKATNNGFER